MTPEEEYALIGRANAAGFQSVLHYAANLEAKHEGLREAARKLVEAYMAGEDLNGAVWRLGVAAGFSQQGDREKAA